MEAGPLPPDGDRVPRWPAGVVGSITHTSAFCAAAVAWQADLRALGLDAEHAIETAQADLVRLVATPAEAAWFAALSEDQRARGAALLFSAKEALYKCQFKLTRERLDFDDVELFVDGVDTVGDSVPHTLHARFLHGRAASTPELAHMILRWAAAGDLVITSSFVTA